jgi:NAD(P)-dependent dehydrogenase (short-subunit alcohol dehydrogenase family)
MSFSGKVIAITGASSGIGRATARILASQGACVSLADTNPSIKKIALSLPGDQMYSAVDVRDQHAVNLWIGNTVSCFGKLDGAVNMAGILTKATPLVETRDEDWDASFAVNAKGVFNCLRAEIRAMKPGGSIVCDFSYSCLSYADRYSGLRSKCLRRIRCYWCRAILRD